MPTMSAYIGNDTGTLFRVYSCLLLKSRTARMGGLRQPILDGNWGIGWGACYRVYGELTGPVVDVVRGIFLLDARTASFMGLPRPEPQSRVPR